MLVQIENLPGEVVEPLAGFGESDFSGPAVEERNTDFFFEDGDSLAHGGLSDAECAGGGSEACVLGGPRKRCEVRKLGGNGGWWGFDHWGTTLAGHARGLMS